MYYIIEDSQMEMPQMHVVLAVFWVYSCGFPHKRTLLCLASLEAGYGALARKGESGVRDMEGKCIT